MPTVVDGKVGELEVWTKLMQDGCNIYLPIADVGVDAIVENKQGNLFRIQVESRGYKPYKEANHEPTYFNVGKAMEKKLDFFIAIVQKASRDEWNGFWIFPIRTDLERFLIQGGGMELASKIRGFGMGGIRAEILSDFKGRWDQITEDERIEYPKPRTRS